MRGLWGSRAARLPKSACGGSGAGTRGSLPADTAWRRDRTRSVELPSQPRQLASPVGAPRGMGTALRAPTLPQASAELVVHPVLGRPMALWSAHRPTRPSGAGLARSTQPQVPHKPHDSWEFTYIPTGTSRKIPTVWCNNIGFCGYIPSGMFQHAASTPCGRPMGMLLAADLGTPPKSTE